MKKEIRTLINAAIHDNRDYIIENCEGNPARYFSENLAVNPSEYYWYLTEDEIEEIESAKDEDDVPHIYEAVNDLIEEYDYDIR